MIHFLGNIDMESSHSNEYEPLERKHNNFLTSIDFYFNFDYIIASHTHILCSESAIIFWVVLSVKINFTILSNKMVPNDIFNQQEKMLFSNWDKLSQKVTKIWQDRNYICNFNWNVNFPPEVFPELCPNPKGIYHKVTTTILYYF